MILVISKKATKKELRKISEDFGGDYIKVVVDVSQNILAGGGERHFDAEQLLIDNGSNQIDLWGGGLDPKTKTIDYNSMINLRPKQNPSRDILSTETRAQFDRIIKDLLL